MRTTRMLWCWTHSDAAPPETSFCWTKARRDILNLHAEDCDITLVKIKEEL